MYRTQKSYVGTVAKLFLSIVCKAYDWLNFLPQKKHYFKVELKYILFRKPTFHRLCIKMKKTKQNKTKTKTKQKHSCEGQAYCHRTIENATVFIWIIT